MPWKDCEECKGTGLMEAKNIRFGRTFYDKESKKIKVEVWTSNGNWSQAKCACVGEEEYLENSTK